MTDTKTTEQPKVLRTGDPGAPTAFDIARAQGAPDNMKKLRDPYVSLFHGNQGTWKLVCVCLKTDVLAMIDEFLKKYGYLEKRTYRRWWTDKRHKIHEIIDYGSHTNFFRIEYDEKKPQ